MPESSDRTKTRKLRIGGLVLFFCLFTHLAFAAAPTLGTITPGSGTGQINTPQTFTATYSDPDGWQNIQYVYLLINSSINGANSFYGYYNQNTNKLYLRNDANTTWLGGYVPGSNNVIENSYAKLNCATTTVSGSGTTLTVNWPVTLKTPFTGAKKTYLYVKDDTNASAGWTQKGTWAILNNAPTLGTITPSSGIGQINTTQTFTATYSDPDGWQNLQYVQLLINTSTTASNCLYVTYNQDTNLLRLRDDNNTTFLGGYAPGSSNVLENSYAKLNCATTTVSGSGTTLTVKWSVTFKNTFIGNKNTYLYAKDDANASAGWVKKGALNILETCALIGPEGGSLVSLNGKIELIIPSGALTTPTVVGFSSVSKETLQGVVPSGTSLLSAVDCQPYGLVFNKPVQIIYRLDNPEVPGTPVELGLYDNAQKKILSTGQTSTVPADGYTVTFSVLHFSTYAALKNLIPQSTPIGAGVKIPLPDLLTGSFSHAIPITVAPGRKGMQPSVALNYRSSNANSWVGLGFSLNPGYIVRSTRLGPPTYNDTQDTFYFITDAGTTELVHLVDNLYQAKIESSFTKFFKEADDSWRVLGKDGGVLRLGQVAEAKEGSSLGTFSWYITKAVDTNGNYLEYYYTKDQGKTYLSRIDYTGNEIGISPTNSVEFFLEARDDISSSYITSNKIATAKRLKEIQVKVNSGLAWRYVLEYAYSPDTNRSLLKSITQSGSDGKSLPVQSLSYQQAK